MITLFIIAVIIGVVILSIRNAATKGRALNATKRSLGATRAVELRCVAGLPIAQGATVAMYDSPSVITFVKDSQQWQLPKSRINFFEVTPGSAIQGGAGSDGSLVVAGCVLAGLPGALIGSLMGSNNYLSIMYTSADGSSKSLLCDVPAGADSQVRAMQNTLQRSRANVPTTTSQL